MKLTKKGMVIPMSNTPQSQKERHKINYSSTSEGLQLHCSKVILKYYIAV